jgi:hypothetical protein
LEISRRRHWKIDRNLLFNIVTARPSKLRKKKKNKKKKKNLQRNFFRFPRKICARKCGSRGILKKASRRKKLSLGRGNGKSPNHQSGAGQALQEQLLRLWASELGRTDPFTIELNVARWMPADSICADSVRACD